MTRSNYVARGFDSRLTNRQEKSKSPSIKKFAFFTIMLTLFTEIGGVSKILIMMISRHATRKYERLWGAKPLEKFYNYRGKKSNEDAYASCNAFFMHSPCKCSCCQKKNDTRSNTICIYSERTRIHGSGNTHSRLLHRPETYLQCFYS